MTSALALEVHCGIHDDVISHNRCPSCDRLVRRAVVGPAHDVSVEKVAAYLPGNYSVIGVDQAGLVVISGRDAAGWTLGDYVIPRLLLGALHLSGVDAPGRLPSEKP